MSSPLTETSAEENREQLQSLYVTALRRRFKDEVNRLTSGAMGSMLKERSDAGELSFLLSYLYAYHWLRRNVAPGYLSSVLAGFKGSSRAFLMELLEHSPDSEAFVRGYIDFWTRAPVESPIQRAQLMKLLAARANDPDRLRREVLEIWRDLGLFTETIEIEYRDLARAERGRYRELLGPEDRARLALIDGLPEKEVSGVQFNKLGLIPAMGCPQTCRHCMFIWRPLVKDYPDPGSLYQQVSALTRSVLFTGGDLSRHLTHFYRAIREMKQVRDFAILLNGDFANNRLATLKVLDAMADAVARRPRDWPQARVLLQISFDEFHQEVVADRKGQLKERIPVERIANIVEAVPRYPDIQLCLLHKQTRLNFSMDVFHQGVFGRLTRELGRRGHQVQLLASTPSSRRKVDPLHPNQTLPVMKDASFVLTRHPESPILLTSSTIDGYGRASLLDEGETLKDRGLLRQVLERGAPEGEYFDTDLMFWFDGKATLFSAVHICLGDVYEDGIETIVARQSRDPLTQALHHFDRRLLAYYAEIRDDLELRLSQATGPHHLFHGLTEDPEVRLHMTRRLIAEGRVS